MFLERMIIEWPKLQHWKRRNYDSLFSGNFATVKLAINKETGDSFALKIIDKKRFLMSNATKRPDALMDEVKILQNLKHPNVRRWFL